jgi:hypothetical protein
LALGAVRGGAGSGLGSGATTGSGEGAGSSANADGAAIAVTSAARDTTVARRVRARRVGVIEAASIVVEAPFGAAGRVTLARPGADDNYLFGQDSAGRTAAHPVTPVPSPTSSPSSCSAPSEAPRD